MLCIRTTLIKGLLFALRDAFTWGHSRLTSYPWLSYWSRIDSFLWPTLFLSIVSKIAAHVQIISLFFEAVFMSFLFFQACWLFEASVMLWETNKGVGVYHLTTHPQMSSHETACLCTTKSGKAQFVVHILQFLTKWVRARGIRRIKNSRIKHSARESCISMCSQNFASAHKQIEEAGKGREDANKITQETENYFSCVH